MNVVVQLAARAHDRVKEHAIQHDNITWPPPGSDTSSDAARYRESVLQLNASLTVAGFYNQIPVALARSEWVIKKGE
jgi:hypothetical protein